ncbi:MAG: pyridoxamine 5'-phosphate oxidase family protein [Acidimicrobiales bacterium]
MAESALEYLRTHYLLVLATASSDGKPHAAPMFYVSDGARIYVSAPDDSQTAANLKANPSAAIAVAEMPSEWTKAKGLQLDGRAEELEGDEEAAAGELFAGRYPFLGDAVRHSHYWRFDPAEVHYVHNEESGDEHFESLGQGWERETVAVDSLDQ